MIDWVIRNLSEMTAPVHSHQTLSFHLAASSVVKQRAEQESQIFSSEWRINPWPIHLSFRSYLGWDFEV